MLIKREKAREKQVLSCFLAPKGRHHWGPLTVLKPGGHVAQDVRRVQSLHDIVPEGVQILPILSRHAGGLAPKEVPASPALHSFESLSAAGLLGSSEKPTQTQC